jgi:hypothetical protein
MTWTVEKQEIMLLVTFRLLGQAMLELVQPLNFSNT